MSFWATGHRVTTQLVKLAAVPPPRAAASVRQLHACHVFSKSADGEARPPTAKQRKRRLDEVCLEKHPEFSRNIIQSWIAQGKVTVDGHPVLKAGSPVGAAARVTVQAEVPKYVCRAGNKLEAVLAAFGISLVGKAALDAGLSTGGFTDCLLQHGAVSVVGVDVGYGQVAERVRTDARVRVMERTNVRNLRLADIGGVPVDVVTLDLSFISVLKVQEAVCSVLRPDGELIVLIKPQFEAGKQQVSSGGVVRDPAVHQQVIARVVAGYEAAGFRCAGWIESPIKGATSGNTEFLAYLQRRAPAEQPVQQGTQPQAAARQDAPSGP